PRQHRAFVGGGRVERAIRPSFARLLREPGTQTARFVEWILVSEELRAEAYERRVIDDADEERTQPPEAPASEPAAEEKERDVGGRETSLHLSATTAPWRQIRRRQAE